MIRKFLPKLGIIAALLLLGTQNSLAAPSTMVFFETQFGNQSPQNSFTATETFENAPNVLSSTQSKEFTGFDPSNTPATMNVTSVGNAFSSFGSLGASVSTTISNPLFPANNAPYVIDQHGGTDPDGVSNAITAIAFAHFSDTLTISSTGALDSIIVSLNLSGSIDVTPPFDPSNHIFGLINVSVNHSNVFGAEEGLFDLQILSDPIAVTNGSADISIDLDAMTSILLEDPILQGSGQINVVVDFLNTLNIVDFKGLDSNGQEVLLTNVTGESGTVFVNRPVSVPEPGTIALLGFGLAGLGFARRRRVNA